MYRKLCFASLLLGAALPLAAQLVTIPSVKPSPLIHAPDEPVAANTFVPSSVPAPWATKRIAQWTDKDAYQILWDSPWARPTPASLARLMTASQRRDGGDMDAQGGGHGGIGAQNAGGLFGSRGAPNRTGEKAEEDHLKLTVRWESAMPVQAAELRTHDNSAPELDGEDYAICVYNVNLKLASIEDMKTLNKDLNRLGVLKIEGREEVHSKRVVTVLMGDGMANVIYFFPRSAHITAEDPRLEFDGQVGRILFSQYFYPPEMMLLGRLEL